MSRTLPNGETEYKTYNQLNYLETETDFKGQVTAYEYDSLGNVTKKKFYTDQSAYTAGTVAEEKTFEYEEGLRLKKITETRGVTEYVYDVYDRLTQINSPEGTINYAYGDQSSRLIRTYSANTDVRYSYDLLGRLTKTSLFKKNAVTLSSAEEISQSFDKLGRKTGMTYPNGIKSSFTYDSLNRLATIDHKKSTGDLLAKYSYSRLKDGSVSSIAEQTLTATGLKNRSLNYSYDSLNRLVEESSTGDEPEHNYFGKYSYDLTGNRLKKELGAETTTYSYNDAGQLTQESSTVAGLSSYEYDSNGALIKKTSNAETASYEYNFEDRMVKAAVARTENAQAVNLLANYAYDNSGFKVRSALTGSVDGNAIQSQGQRYLTDVQNLTGYTQIFEEYEQSSLQKSYVIGDDVYAQTMGASSQYLHYDQHGSTRLLSASNGLVAENYSYDAYGGILNGKGDYTNPTQSKFLYSGEQYDSSIGMQYLRARHYNQDNGTFNRLDPFSGDLSNPQSLNKYGYTHADPVNGIDPTGKFFTISGAMVSMQIQGLLRNMKTGNTVRKYKKVTDQIAKINYAVIISINFAVMIYEEPKLSMSLVLHTFNMTSYQKHLVDRVRKRIASLAPAFYTRMYRVLNIFAIGPDKPAGDKVFRKTNGFYNFSAAMFGSSNTQFGKELLSRETTFFRLKKSRGRDFTKANKMTGRKGSKSPSGRTWHHHEVPGVMMLLDRDEHGGHKHDGGRMIVRMSYPKYSP